MRARCEVAPAELGLGGGWRRTARLAGAIFPVVSPAEPTLLTPVSAADALARLVRQTPWLLAQRPTAPAVLALLTRAVAGGVFSLRLGSDTYRKPARLAASLGALDLVLIPSPQSSPPVPLSTMWRGGTTDRSFVPPSPHGGEGGRG